MARRTATSIVLLIMLVAGSFTPTAFCALMCERHTRVESPRHCVQSSDAMPGMVHDHSAMNPPAVEIMNLVMMSQSCQTNCVTAERLDTSRKIVPQVRAVHSQTVVLDTTVDFLAADATAVWGLDSSPPAPSPAHVMSFSILRI